MPVFESVVRKIEFWHVSTEGSDFFFIPCTGYSTAVQHQYTWEVEAIWIMGETKYFLRQPNSCLHTFSHQESRSNCVKLHKDLENIRYAGIQGYWILRGDSQIWPRRSEELDQYPQKALEVSPPGSIVYLNCQQQNHHPCCHLIMWH